MVIQAMDMGIIFPVAVLSGILIIRNDSFGYLLTSVIIIKGTTMLLALVMMIVFMTISGVPVTIIEIAGFSSLAVFYIINFFLMLKNVK